MLSAMIFGGSVLGGVVAGCAYLLIGGLGVARTLARRCSELEQSVDSLEGRLTREVKRRAAMAATESKADAKSVRELADEATRRLAANGPTTPDMPPHGLPSMFRNG